MNQKVIGYCSFKIIEERKEYLFGKTFYPSKECVDLVLVMLEPDHYQRPCLQVLRQHPFFNGVFLSSPVWKTVGDTTDTSKFDARNNSILSDVEAVVFDEDLFHVNGLEVEETSFYKSFTNLYELSLQTCE
jgi:hypothetical protein